MLLLSCHRNACCLAGHSPTQFPLSNILPFPWSLSPLHHFWKHNGKQLQMTIIEGIKLNLGRERVQEPSVFDRAVSLPNRLCTSTGQNGVTSTDEGLHMKSLSWQLSSCSPSHGTCEREATRIFPCISLPSCFPAPDQAPSHGREKHFSLWWPSPLLLEVCASSSPLKLTSKVIHLPMFLCRTHQTVWFLCSCQNAFMH